MAVHFHHEKIPSTHGSVTEAAKHLVKFMLCLPLVKRLSLGTMGRTKKSSNAGRRAKFVSMKYNTCGFRIVFLSSQSKQEFFIHCTDPKDIPKVQKQLMDNFVPHKKRGIQFSGDEFCCEEVFA